jgi:hypothetical protein
MLTEGSGAGIFDNRVADFDNKMFIFYNTLEEIDN